MLSYVLSTQGVGYHVRYYVHSTWGMGHYVPYSVYTTRGEGYPVPYSVVPCPWNSSMMAEACCVLCLTTEPVPCGNKRVDTAEALPGVTCCPFRERLCSLGGIRNGLAEGLPAPPPPGPEPVALDSSVTVSRGDAGLRRSCLCTKTPRRWGQ